jgi:uncharacterized protein YdeI (YjbR/CyaY-like superfamily)
MGTRDPRVDAYISKSQDFAKPVLKYVREIVHESCPDCEETIKWGTVAFDYKGPFIGIAAFKAHAALMFWKGKLIFDNNDPRQFRNVTSVADLPRKKQLAGYIRKAMALNDQGVKVAMRSRSGPAKPLRVPPVLAAALKKSKKAQATFDAFPPGQRNEYVAWITEAKTDGTRSKRLATAIEWMAEGKPRNWKYMKR